MARAYNVIDSDGHILEPLTLWNDYMDPAFRDRAPEARHRQGRQGAAAGRGPDPRQPAGHGRHRRGRRDVRASSRPRR